MYTMCSVYQQREKQLFEDQVVQLGEQMVQIKAEVAIAAEERDALRGQLKDFVVSLQYQYMWQVWQNSSYKHTRALSQVTYCNKPSDDSIHLANKNNWWEFQFVML